MNKKLFGLILPLLLVFGSCSEQDPFTGTNGIRFNMNGKKYVLHNGLFKMKPMSKTEDGVTISSTLNGPTALDICSITIKLCPLDQLVADTEYHTGEYGISSEVSILSMDVSDMTSVAKETSESGDLASEIEEETESAPPVQLQGWVKRVASETAELELLFEFNGTDEAGNEYVIKHGFLRL